MQHNNNRFNIHLSTLNFVLCFIGYQLATSLLLPVSSDIEGISRSVTIPYRAFALFVSLLVIMNNFRRPIGILPSALKVFLFFWGILVIRIYYDVYIRTDVDLNDTTQLWLYVFGICLPAVFSIIRSYKYIDLEIAFYWILGLTALILIISLFSNQALLVSSDELEGRQEGNLAFNTIAFGHLGATTIILSIYILLKRKLNYVQQGLVITSILLSIFCLLRAGSRGPILALVVVLFFWLFSHGKNVFWGALILTIASVLLLVFLDQILELMGNISPTIEARLKSSIDEGDTSGRDPLYKEAFNAFLYSPLFGKQFAIFSTDGSFSYSHNIILDALMGLGIIGGSAIIFFIGAALKKSYYLIKKNDAHFWICLLLIQQIMFNMTSGAFYYNQLLSALLTFLFLYRIRKKQFIRKQLGNQDKTIVPQYVSVGWKFRKKRL